MDYDNPKIREWLKNRKPANPIFLKVFEKMYASGELEGLSDEVALEKIVSITEKIMQDSQNKKD